MTYKISEFMVEKVYRVTPDMTLLEVAEMLLRHQISGAPIVDASDHVISVIGEGSTLRLAATAGLTATIAHCLPKLPAPEKVVTLKKDDTFTEAYRAFLKNNVHRIPIVDSQNLLLGLITRTTIFRIFVEAHHGKKIQRPPT